MQVTLYTDFTKRTNSTKSPDHSPGEVITTEVISAVLKDDSSLLTPVIEIQGIKNPVYVKIFNWFYNVKNIIMGINNWQRLELELDHLATFRSAILSTTAFTRYSSVLFNSRIPDTRITTLVGEKITHYANLFGEIYDNADRYEYYLSVMTDNGVQDWLLTYNEMSTLIDELINNGQSVFGSLTTQFTDALSCLLKCRIVPISETAFHGTRQGTNIRLGQYVTGVTGFMMSRSWFETQDFIDISLPNDFQLTEPYTYCRLALPFVGMVDISAEELYGTTKLRFSINGNASTGKIRYIIFRDSIDVSSSDSNIIGEYDGTFGMDIPIGGQEMQNPIGVLSATASLGVAALSPSPVSITNGIAQTRQAYLGMQRSTTMIGGFGGNGGWQYDRRLKLELFTKDLSEVPSNMNLLYGQPLDRLALMSTLVGGYVQTEGFSINIPAIDEIKKRINRSMDSGVYLE